MRFKDFLDSYYHMGTKKITISLCTEACVTLGFFSLADYKQGKVNVDKYKFCQIKNWWVVNKLEGEYGIVVALDTKI